jgi:hypothetical protein
MFPVAIVEIPLLPPLPPRLPLPSSSSSIMGEKCDVVKSGAIQRTFRQNVLRLSL